MSSETLRDGGTVTVVTDCLLLFTASNVVIQAVMSSAGVTVSQAGT